MGLLKNGGSIRMITSPRLSKEDWEAINNGYDLKKKMSEVMIRDLTFDNEDCENSIRLLSKLIVAGRLDIKVAIMKDELTDSMFHAKFGIATDCEGNSIAFTGSANDSYYGLRVNWDTISIVERHFSSDDKSEHEVQKMFDTLWNNKDESARVYELPDEIKLVFEEESKKQCRYEGELVLDGMIFEEKTKSVFFKCPDYIDPKEYQLEAVSKWKNQGYSGIFNMATGTGKTITGLLALETLYNDCKGGLFTIIVCPQKHLVDQWVDNVQEFGVYPIIGYSDPKYSDWKSRFKNAIMSFGEGTNNCLITTISSFSMEDVQTWVSRIDNLVLVVDEVHNMGSSLRLQKLPANAKYRLGLSATVERYKDVSGTDGIRSYFGDECINFPITDAIGKVLTKYVYHPLVCYFDNSELSSFQDINEQIEIISNDKMITEKRKQALIREQQLRGILLLSRLKSKMKALIDLMEECKDDDHILIYCGKTRYSDNDEDSDPDLQKEGIRLIDKVVSELGLRGLGIRLSKFTYMESPDERRKILQNFESGDIQALVAISCLDEGVNIPSIRTAIITSSSENPKEYVQRRGRVLRKHPGKGYAVIYDMVAIPKNLDDHNDYSCTAELEMKLLCREIARVQEFSKDSINPEESHSLIDKISESYGIEIEEMMDRFWS